MSLRVISLFTILQVYSLIGLSFSSTFLKFGDKSVPTEYDRLKSASVHRGVILSWSKERKHEACEDIFGAQLYIDSIIPRESSEEAPAKMAISDSVESVQRKVEPEYPIFLRRTAESIFSTPTWNLSFRCYGRNFRQRSPTGTTSNWYHVYTAFYPKWLYSASPIVSSDNSFALKHFITLSPDHVDLPQRTLEKHYVNTQVKLMTLQKESPEYVDLIIKRSSLMTLTRLQKFILCASILSSPVYRKEGLEFSFDWMDTTTSTLKYVKKRVSLTSTLYPKQKIKVTCVPCEAFENGTDLLSRSETLYLTATHDDEYSVVVLRQDEGHFYVDKYFKNIAILMTLFEHMDYAKLISNFPRPELTNESELD